MFHKITRLVHNESITHCQKVFGIGCRDCIFELIPHRTAWLSLDGEKGAVVTNADTNGSLRNPREICLPPAKAGFPAIQSSPVTRNLCSISCAMLSPSLNGLQGHALPILLNHNKESSGCFILPFISLKFPPTPAISVGSASVCLPSCI